MDTAMVILTAALVGITAYYAKQTRATVKEMQTARKDAETARRREKSEAAARRALQGVLALQNHMREIGPAGVPGHEIWASSQLSDAEAPLIADADVSGCVGTCGTLAYTASWSNDLLHQEAVGSVGMVRLRLQEALNATRLILEDYLRERPFDSRHRKALPERIEAQAWILRREE